MSQKSPMELAEQDASLDRFPVLTLNRPLIRRNNVIGFESRALEARPLNLLRTTLAKKLKAAGHRIIGITSAAPDAGKSFLTMNLGAAMAQVSDGPIFLVDLDLRRASLAASIGLDPAKSVNEYLTAKSGDIAEAGVRVYGTSLVVFPASRIKKATADFLSGERLSLMFAALRAMDSTATVLVDLPPVFADDDAMLIADHLDSYLIVVDAGRTTKKQVKEAVALMRPLPCSGTVLNRYQGGLLDPYGYGYGYGSYSAYYK